MQRVSIRQWIRYKPNLFHKMFYSLLINVVVFGGISIAIIHIAERNAKREMLSSVEANVNYYMNNLESDVERILTMQQQYINDYDLQLLSVGGNYINNYERGKSILGLQKQLYLLSNVSKYIDNVSVQIPLIRKVVSADSLTAEWDQQKFETMSAFHSVRSHPFFVYDNGIYMNIPYPGAADGDHKAIYNLSVRISQTEMRKSMRLFTNDLAWDIVMFDNGDEWRVTAADDSTGAKIGEAYRETGWRKSGSRVQGTVVVDSKRYWILADAANSLNATLVAYVPESVITGSTAAYRRAYLYLLLFSAAILAMYTYLNNRLFTSPLRKIIKAFQKVESGNLSYAISHKRTDEFAYLYDKFNSMLQNVNDLFKQVYEQKIMTQQAELKQLQYQINPHFLYNSLYMIYRMAKLRDHEKITQLAKSLGGYYRYITRSNSEDVYLEQEYEHAKLYAEIQTLRFGDRIRVEFGDIPQSCEKLKVPCLILQPLIENAYGHGLENMQEGGILRIRMNADETHLCVMIEDSGKGIDPQRMEELERELMSGQPLGHPVTGIINVHRRIRLKYGESSGLQLGISPLGGLRISLIIARKGGGADV